MPKVGAYIEGYVEVLGIGAHTVLAIDNRNMICHVDGHLFGLVHASVEIEATDIDFLGKSDDYNFLARVRIDVTEFSEGFKRRIGKL